MRDLNTMESHNFELAHLFPFYYSTTWWVSDSSQKVAY